MNESAHINIKDSIRNLIFVIALIIIIIVGGVVYSKYNYNDYIKSVREDGITSFLRDDEVKYSNKKSYKIENRDYNDAMFYKNIEIKPYTAYKVTCMVKTQAVENEKDKYTGGAQIVIKDTIECSKSVVGDTDWTKITFMFNSKNRTNIDIGFRLGGYEEKSKGIAWFSDFKIEEGALDRDNDWNVACFIIKDLDVIVNLNGKSKDVKLSMSKQDILDIENNLKRLPSVIANISNNKVMMNCDIIKIDKPLKSITYDEENEYYIAPSDVQDLIKEHLEKEEYDYIYIAARLGKLNDESKNLLTHDWIGLGGMAYYDIGFSNLRLPDSSNSYIYKYDSRINTFPEEVFVHEFLHTLERNEKEFGNTNLAKLHDNEKYGYKRENVDGLRKWYRAYMQNKIKNAENLGLTENAYMSKPIHESNFKYACELSAFKEPENIIEEINSLVNRVKKLFE